MTQTYNLGRSLAPLASPDTLTPLGPVQEVKVTERAVYAQPRPGSPFAALSREAIYAGLIRAERQALGHEPQHTGESEPVRAQRVNWQRSEAVREVYTELARDLNFDMVNDTSTHAGRVACSCSCPFVAQGDFTCLPSGFTITAFQVMLRRVWACHDEPRPCAGAALNAAALGLPLRGQLEGEEGPLATSVFVQEVQIRPEQEAGLKRIVVEDPSNSRPERLAGRWLAYRVHEQVVQIGTRFWRRVQPD